MNASRKIGKIVPLRQGFSFLEIMLVVVIIGIMMAVIGPRLAGKSKKAKEIATKQQLQAIETALGSYEMEVGEYPTTEQGLKALVVRPNEVPEDQWSKSMKEVPKDSWGNDFIYRCPGQHNEDYDLLSPGKDKKEGTDDDIANYKPGEKAGAEGL
jgi:general secretion pathway protein G